MRNLSAVLVAFATLLADSKSSGLPRSVIQNTPAMLVVPYSTIFGEVRSSNSILAYKIDDATGNLSLVAGSPFAAGSEPSLAAIAPSGDFAYVINKQSQNISAYAIEPRTGKLMQTRGSPFALDYSPEGPVGVVIDPRGRHVYVVSSVGISAFSIDPATGKLIPIPGSPFARSQDIGTSSLAIAPSNRFAYILDYFHNTISTYTIDATGALKLAGSLPNAGQNSNSPGFSSVTIDPRGKFAYVTGSERYIYVYAIDATTGALTASAHLSLGEPGVSALAGFAIDPTGRFAYALDAALNQIDALVLDPTSGKLKALAPPNYSRSAGGSPYSLTVDPTGKFAYVLNPRAIYAYRIDAGSGRLTPLVRAPFAVAASTTDPVARWFDSGLCAAFESISLSDAHPQPFAKHDSNLVFDRPMTPLTSWYFYDPKGHYALHYPRSDGGGTIALRVAAGPPPRGVPPADLSWLQTTSGIKLGSRAAAVVNALGEPKIVNGCNEQLYVYVNRTGEPLPIEFTIRNGIVIEISEERGG
ncbi:MAG: beta-propeller fold lactonase family protein [Candidatus Eremiobacteraeota bacterium]|nr:beta-propeller fold lactonase family protein [Candidatus Eremiobacteraeota bacterium]